MSGEPRIRAGYSKASLMAVARLGPRVQRAVHAALPDILDVVRNAGHGDWLPVDFNVRVVREVCKAAGPSALRDWHRRTVFDAVQGPLLQPLWSAVVNLFGLTPSMTLRRAPLGWELVYRDCGLLTVVPRGANEMQLRVEGACQAFLDDVDYVEWICGGVEAAVDLGGARGIVYANIDRPGRRLELEVRW
ncbi:MAG: hypothetical protein A2138_15715 [Deltaproteobacteria bacterium RBG_16_71_12]|nr:MAG: hypothetical protein A2138_15715 [Deltaproteobacteria bacterium RBG_16_71_12]